MSYEKHVALGLTGILLLSALGLYAQGSLGGPVSGLVFDTQTRSIRPVLGVPGGAYVGPAVAAGLEWASVAPSGQFAIGFADGRLELLRRQADLSMTSALLEEGCGAPSKAAWAAGSGAVAVYWAETGRLQVWRGLATEPEPAEPADLSAFGGRVTALAVDVTGGVILAAAGAGSGGVYAVAPGGLPVLLVPADPGALVLAPNGRDIFVADITSRQVLQVQDYRGSAAVIPLAAPDGDLAEPVGIAVSPDGKRLFVAGKADQTLSVYDLTSQTLISRMALEFVPEGLDPLSNSGLFLLRSGTAGGEPFQVLDGALEPAIYFIPAAELPAEEE